MADSPEKSWKSSSSRPTAQAAADSSWGKTLRKFGWVVGITVLIWLYAEREQVATEKNVRFPIEVKSPNATRYVVTLREPRDKVITADLSGPRSRLTNVRDRLLREGPAIPVEVDPNLGPGVHSVRSLTQLRDQPIFRSNGISLSNCQPDLLTVQVDPILERDAAVQLAPEAAALVANVTFEPKQVKLRGPQSLLESEAETVVYAALPNIQALRGTHHDLPSVPIVRPAHLRDPNVTVEVQNVRVVLDLKQTNVSWTVPAMPIFPLPAPDLWEKFRLVHVSPNAPILTNVTVWGAPEKVDLLKSESFKPKAILELSREDADDGSNLPRTKRLRYELPEGVSVSPADAQRTIEFRLLPRSGTE